ncbi:hypothetical protein R5R35_011490 [Gryllus longicercus]|uniref:Uncharacterized protein n=1 Tax=Gryllus longicercus TaxID=2509291 RepID=A0AAN9VFK5_9ORTH
MAAPSAHARSRLAACLRALWLGALLAATVAAGATSECSRWPSDHQGSDWEHCRACLRARGQTPVDDASRTELVRSRPCSPLLDEVPGVICRLWAENCSISNISHAAFAQAPCLRRISLAANTISELDPLAFSGNHELLELGLQRNGLVLRRERPVINSTSLRILDLSFCNISVVFNLTFSAIPNVSILMLRANKIHALSYDVFASLSRLEVLDVSENAITRIDFASKLNFRCFYAERNPIKEVLPILVKFRSNGSLVFSQTVCCCNAASCDDRFAIRSASQWISKCEHCHNKFPIIEPTEQPTLLSNESSTAVVVKLKYDFDVRTHPISTTNLETKNTQKTHAANLTIILLCTVFSFLILVLTSIIVCLLKKQSKRNVKSDVFLARVVVPSLIYGQKEQVTDLDEESCSYLSVNHVYEVIPE